MLIGASARHFLILTVTDLRRHLNPTRCADSGGLAFYDSIHRIVAADFYAAVPLLALLALVALELWLLAFSRARDNARHRLPWTGCAARRSHWMAWRAPTRGPSPARFRHHPYG